MSRLRRWLAATLALVLASAAGYVLVTLHHDHAGEIDAASREKLLQVLREEPAP